MSTNSISAPTAHHFPMTNRRAFLAAAPALAALTAAPAIAAAATLNVDEGFERCVAAYREADQHARQFNETILCPAEGAYYAVEAATPHYTTKASFEAYDHRQVHMSTSEPSMCRIAREHAAKSFGGDDFARTCEELRTALDEREAALEAARNRYRVDELGEQYDQLANVEHAALREVERYPVRSLADLQRKLEIFAAAEFDEMPMDVVLADVRRIREARS